MISVIVLSKNNGDTLDGCLRSIIKANEEKEIIVVDAHSTDKTPQILKKYHGKIRVVFDEGKGIGIARNLGVTRTKGDIICFVDADAYCSKDHFVKIKKFFCEHPEVGVVGVRGTIKVSDSSTFVERMENMLRHTRKVMGLDMTSSEITQVAGCFIALKKKVFDEVGGFWEFPPYGADDNDFCMKALASGWKIGIVDTESWHSPRTTFSEFWKEMWGWGKGKACWVKKWSNHPLAIQTYRDQKIFRILGKNLWCYTVIAYLSSPLTALRYLPITKSISFYLFYILRQYIYLLGFLWGWITWARKMIS